MPDIENSGRAIIEDGSIVIRLAISALPLVIEGAWASCAMNTRYRVTDAEQFAKDLVATLNAEEEDGTTRIHLMFDDAVEEAMSQGAEGIEEHDDQQR